MKGIRKKVSDWVHVVAPLVIWVVVLLAFGVDFDRPVSEIGLEAVTKLSYVVAIYSVLVIVFVNWAWRLRIFKGWLVQSPNLQGTWKGTLESTWIDPETKQKIPPKGVTLVIKQTLSTISCVMYTDESESFSNTAQINEDDDSGIFRLSYNYTNRPKASVRERSEIHDGAAILKVNESERTLEGEYWTSRKTTGEIRLEFFSKKLHQAHS